MFPETEFVLGATEQGNTAAEAEMLDQAVHHGEVAAFDEGQEISDLVLVQLSLTDHLDRLAWRLPRW